MLHKFINWFVDRDHSCFIEKEFLSFRVVRGSGKLWKETEV